MMQGLAEALADLGPATITPLLNLFFKTVKDHANQPGFYKSRKEAETWLGTFVKRYHQAPHSSLRGYTPFQAYTKAWQEVWALRQQARDAYFPEHPSRFRKPPHAIPMPNLVSTNVSQAKTQLTQEDRYNNYLTTIAYISLTRARNQQQSSKF